MKKWSLRGFSLLWIIHIYDYWTLDKTVITKALIEVHLGKGTMLTANFLRSAFNCPGNLRSGFLWCFQLQNAGNLRGGLPWCPWHQLQKRVWRGITSDRWWPQTLWLKPGGWGRHRSVRLVSASWYQSVQAFVKLKLLPDLKQMSYNASLSMQKDSSEFSTSWRYHVTRWILIKNKTRGKLCRSL